MTKLDLQQELLEKVKPGTKPSDIKKQVKPSPKPVNQDEGYESDSSGKSVPATPPFKPNLSKSGPANNLSLPNQDLLNQISSLQKRLATYQDFKEADLKIKEKLKEENQQLTQELADTQTRLRASFDERSLMNKTITNLQSQAKTPTEIKQQPNETTSPKLYLFTCSICDQNKKSQLHLAKVNGLGIDPTQLQKICDYCLKRVDIIKAREEDFF